MQQPELQQPCEGCCSRLGQGSTAGQADHDSPNAMAQSPNLQETGQHCSHVCGSNRSRAGQGRAGQGQDLHGHKAQPGKLEASTAVAGLHQPQQHQAKCEERHHQSTQPQLHNREPSALSASTEDMMSTCQARRASSVHEI